MEKERPARRRRPEQILRGGLREAVGEGVAAGAVAALRDAVGTAGWGGEQP